MIYLWTKWEYDSQVMLLYHPLKESCQKTGMTDFEWHLDPKHHYCVTPKLSTWCFNSFTKSYSWMKYHSFCSKIYGHWLMASHWFTSYLWPLFCIYSRWALVIVEYAELSGLFFLSAQATGPLNRHFLIQLTEIRLKMDLTDSENNSILLLYSYVEYSFEVLKKGCFLKCLCTSLSFWSSDPHLSI